MDEKDTMNYYPDFGGDILISTGSVTHFPRHGSYEKNNALMGTTAKLAPTSLVGLVAAADLNSGLPGSHSAPSLSGRRTVWGRLPTPATRSLSKEFFL